MVTCNGVSRLVPVLYFSVSPSAHVFFPFPFSFSAYLGASHLNFTVRTRLACADEEGGVSVLADVSHVKEIRMGGFS